MRILCLFLFIYNFSFSQTEKIEVIEIKSSDYRSIPEEKVGDLAFDEAIPFAVVEQIPLFESCKNVEKLLQNECFQEEIRKHIKTNLKYPKEAKKNKIECKVSTLFDIDINGTIINLKVRSSNKNDYNLLFEKEAKRIVNKFPKFIPAKQRGKAVKVRYSIPINFKL